MYAGLGVSVSTEVFEELTRRDPRGGEPGRDIRASASGVRGVLDATEPAVRPRETKRRVRVLGLGGEDRVERGDELVETVLARVRFPEEGLDAAYRDFRREGTFAVVGGSDQVRDARVRGGGVGGVRGGGGGGGALAERGLLVLEVADGVDGGANRANAGGEDGVGGGERRRRLGPRRGVGTPSRTRRGVVAATEGEERLAAAEMRLGPVWSRGDARVGGVEGVRGETRAEERGGTIAVRLGESRQATILVVVLGGSGGSGGGREEVCRARETRGGEPRVAGSERRRAGRLGRGPRVVRGRRDGGRGGSAGVVSERSIAAGAIARLVRSSARNTSSSVMDSEKWSASAPFRRCQPYIAPSRGVVWRPRDAVANVVTPPGRRFDSPKQESPNAAHFPHVPKTSLRRATRANVASTTRADLTNAGARGARDVTPRRARSTEISLAAVPSTVPGPSPRARWSPSD